MNWYIEALKKYVVVSGRARRKEYWMFMLINLGISLGLALALGFFQGLFGLSDKLPSLVNGVFSVATLIPSFTVGVRRMHDTGHSGWWILVPIVNLIFACTEGHPGDNKFGADPKALARDKQKQW